MRTWSRGYDWIIGQQRLTSASTCFRAVDGKHHIMFKGYGADTHDHLYFTYDPKTGLFGGTSLKDRGVHVRPTRALANEHGVLVTRIEAKFQPAQETYTARFAPVAPTSNQSSAPWTALHKIKNEPRELAVTFGESGAMEVRLWPEGFQGKANDATTVLPLSPKDPTQLSVTWLP
jgi:hypothetical protein